MNDRQAVMEAIAKELLQAEASSRPIAQPSLRHPDLSIDEAYGIQLLNIKARTQAGRRVTGKKIGLTSLPMQRLLGVDQPDFGHLLDDIASDGASIPSARLIQPKIEGEIAFILQSDLIGTNNTAADVLRATSQVLPALEIVDSRVADWKITIVDTVADNASSGLYVLGSQGLPAREIDLAAETMRLYRNGRLINEGTGSAVLGDPALAVAWLANRMNHYGVPLKAGEIILSGALTAALPCRPGDTFQAVFGTLGSVSARFT